MDSVIAKHKTLQENTLDNLSYSFNTFDRLFNKIIRRDKVLKLSGLKGSSNSYLVSILVKKLEMPILYLVSSKEIAETESENIAFFLGEKPPILLKKEPDLTDALFSSVTREYAERISWLYFANKKKIFIAEASALFQKSVPVDVLANTALKIQKYSEIARDNLISKLIQMGYVRSEFVERIGEVSIRGSIIDLFPPGYNNPLRLELLGDEVRSIRFFKVDDQKSLEKIDDATILPVSEVILTEEAIKQCLSYVRKKAAEQEMPASAKISLIEEIEKGIRFPEIEWILPSFYKKLNTVFDYIPQETLIIFDNPDEISKSFKAYFKNLPDIENSMKRHLKISPDFHELYLTEDQLKDEISRYQAILIEDVEIYEKGVECIRFDTETVPVNKEAGYDSPFDFLCLKIQEWQSLGIQVNLVLETA
ncbi:MAG TPA: hypothetical protein VH878_00920, partial [Thermodesulfobacteriota bacterium]